MTSIEMKDLRVVQAYTTTDEESSSFGAITLTCQTTDGLMVDVRTIPLYDENKALITEDLYLGKTIDVKGIVDFFDGTYQIKIFTTNGITIHP